MFTPKYIKEGKMLLKGVAKFVHYKRDILSEEKLAEIGEKQAAFRVLLKSGDKEKVQEQAKELQKSCERSLPMPTFPGVRENVEVFFVAIVIALGIRSYFLQPFKIPTGSMQPTLNGIIATGFDQSSADEANWEKVKPNPVMKIWDLFWRGRNYVDLVAKEDYLITGGYQRNPFKFFSFTYIERTTPDGSKMKPLRIWAPMDKVLASQNDPGLGLTRALAETGARLEMIKGNANTPRFRVSGGAARIAAGTILARGYIDTGDQVLVNKFSYHFRPPKRGEVFVFTTQDIELIMARSPNRQSQHYIKRLCAVPGDAYEVKPSKELFINGERAKEPGMVRVMSMKDGYNGYAIFGGDRRNNDGELKAKEYLALGDNSLHSWDSRGWGSVPEKNLVGPALFVYWPFGAHWGLIH